MLEPLHQEIEKKKKGMKISKTANKESNRRKIETFAIGEASGNLDVEDEGNAGEDVAGDDGLEQGSEAAGEVEGGGEVDPGEEGAEGDELPERDSLHGHHLAPPTNSKPKSQPPPTNQRSWFFPFPPPWLCFAVPDANRGRNQEKYDKDSQRKEGEGREGRWAWPGLTWEAWESPYQTFPFFLYFVFFLFEWCFFFFWLTGNRMGIMRGLWIGSDKLDLKKKCFCLPTLRCFIHFLLEHGYKLVISSSV